MSRSGSIGSPKKYKAGNKKFWSTFFILEVLIMLIFPWPFYERYVELSYFDLADEYDPSKSKSDFQD